MATKADAHIVSLTDLKQVTQRSPTDSETGSVSERQSGNGIVLDDTLHRCFKQIVRLQKHPIAATNKTIWVRFDDDQKPFLMIAPLVFISLYISPLHAPISFVFAPAASAV